MTKPARGRVASLPPAGYVRPRQVDPSGLVITHVTEDGSSTTLFDFRSVDCPTPLLHSMTQGFAVACSPGGRWNSARSAENGAAAMRAFIRALAEQSNPPVRIEELSPEVWWAWRAEVAKTNRWPSRIQLVQGLLTDTPGVPESTRRALRARLPKPKRRSYDSYSRNEFHRIRSAAAGIVRTGLHRIETNTATLAAYRAGEEPHDAVRQCVGGRDWTVGSLLDCLARTGTLPVQRFSNARGRLRSLVNLDGAKTISEALFPNSVEILAACILLVCERGYNCSVLDTLTVDDIERVDDHRDDEPVYLLHLDKPRRGARGRYSDESLTGEAGGAIARTLALTAQARETVGLLGNPTNSLLVFLKASAGSRRGAGLFETKVPREGHFVQCWQDRTQLLADDGTPLWLSLQRLRLTEQVLNKRPRQNSAQVSETVYRQPDPQTRKEAAAVIVGGQIDAVEHARVTVAMRTVSDHELAEAQANPAALGQRLGVAPERVRLLLSGALNTATGACLDFGASPFAKETDDGCPASFLACLGCSNAVATPSHIPRLVALSKALERICSAVTSEVWAEDYASHYARLNDVLVSNTTSEQRVHALRQMTTEDEAMLNRLLSRGLDE